MSLFYRYKLSQCSHFPLPLQILNSFLKVIERLANDQVVKLHTFANINVSTAVSNIF